jgi:hypothetical protein
LRRSAEAVAAQRRELPPGGEVASGWWKSFQGGVTTAVFGRQPEPQRV